MKPLAKLGLCLTFIIGTSSSAWGCHECGKQDDEKDPRWDTCNVCDTCSYYQTSFQKTTETPRSGWMNVQTMGWGANSSSNTTTSTWAGSDSDIMQKVHEAISKNSSTSGNNIQISVTNGKVTLTGTVGSDSEKSMAGSKARSVTGVTTVDNKLTVSK